MNTKKKYRIYLNPVPYLYYVVANTENDLPGDSKAEVCEVKGWNPGSVCICLAEKTIYMLNVDKEWTKITIDLDEIIGDSK